MHLKKIANGFSFAAIANIDNMICNKYAAIMRDYPRVAGVCITNFLHTNKVTRGVLRVPITQSLTFLSSLQVSIPKKRL